LIVIDSSALLAILQNEPLGEACFQCIRSADDLLMSAATLTEALIVSRRRGIGVQMDRLISGMPLTIAPVTESSAKRAAEAYDRWGRGAHPARLNFGDCFAYELAQSRNCSLLFVGDDFSRTDVKVALV
jgi:ribonuclease VapC